MTVQCGIVGLPNVGKSTLFNSLTAAQVPAENFPFCTVDPHKGIVEVPDPRLTALATIVKPEKVVPAVVTFVDIAGLVQGAASGEGLGNQFLSHIREVDAIVHVVRCFRDTQIIHVMGEPQPKRDVEIIELELCLADLDTVKKRLERIERKAKSGDEASRLEASYLERFAEGLSRGIPLRRLLKENWKEKIQDTFLTSKPILYVANVSEADFKQPGEEVQKWLGELKEIAALDESRVLTLAINLESQLSQIPESERLVFYEEFGIQEPGLHRLIRDTFGLLGRMTYFTAGEKEVRAWTVPIGCSAPEAAGAIHTDFKKGFIRAEVIAFEDYIAQKGEKGAREKGLQRSEGKDYTVKNGDVIFFKFAV